MAFKAAIGITVLHRTGKNRYSPAIVNSINADGSLNLTVFASNGQTGLARDVVEGDNEGNWCAPGIEVLEQKMAEAPPEFESPHSHPPPLDYPAAASKPDTAGKK